TLAASPRIEPLSLHDALPISGKPQNLRERLFGSTADRIVCSGPCPILVVKRETNKHYSSVVAAIDFSPMSFAAAQAAARLAPQRSEEHTSELQSRENLVCRLL